MLHEKKPLTSLHVSQVHRAALHPSIQKQLPRDTIRFAELFLGILQLFDSLSTSINSSSLSTKETSVVVKATIMYMQNCSFEIKIYIYITIAKTLKNFPVYLCVCWHNSTGSHSFSYSQHKSFHHTHHPLAFPFHILNARCH